jgi:hypothetical protein
VDSLPACLQGEREKEVFTGQPHAKNEFPLAGLEYLLDPGTGELFLQLPAKEVKGEKVRVHGF